MIIVAQSDASLSDAMIDRMYYWSEFVPPARVEVLGTRPRQAQMSAHWHES